MSIFSKQLSEWISKRCKNITFADEVFFSTKYNKRVKIVQQPELKL